MVKKEKSKKAKSKEDISKSSISKELKSQESKIPEKPLDKKETNSKKDKEKVNLKSKASLKNFPSLQLKTERDIAMDFAQKAYETFGKLIKSIILFGSTIKQTRTTGSDIDIIIIIDDATLKFEDKLISWYRQELGELIKSNPYKKDLHINTVKLTTWWQDLQRGDPTIINILRYGETLIDFGGFFKPLKILLQENYHMNTSVVS